MRATVFTIATLTTSVAASFNPMTCGCALCSGNGGTSTFARATAVEEDAATDVIDLRPVFAALDAADPLRDTATDAGLLLLLLPAAVRFTSAGVMTTCEPFIRPEASEAERECAPVRLLAAAPEDVRRE